jgi:hypothetical protein
MEKEAEDQKEKSTFKARFVHELTQRASAAQVVLIALLNSCRSHRPKAHRDTF